MKLFCAYAFTGEDLEIVTKRMQLVVDTLNGNGHQAYCNRFDPIMAELQQHNDIKGIFYEAFKYIENSDALVTVITSPNRSVGQIMEIGIGLSQKKPIYLFEHASAKDSTYLPRLVDEMFTWQTEDDLKSALQNI